MDAVCWRHGRLGSALPARNMSESTVDSRQGGTRLVKRLDTETPTAGILERVRQGVRSQLGSSWRAIMSWSHGTRGLADVQSAEEMVGGA